MFSCNCLNVQFYAQKIDETQNTLIDNKQWEKYKLERGSIETKVSDLVKIQCKRREKVFIYTIMCENCLNEVISFIDKAKRTGFDSEKERILIPVEEIYISFGVRRGEEVEALKSLKGYSDIFGLNLDLYVNDTGKSTLMLEHKGLRNKMNHWLHIQENRLNSEIDEFARKQREKLVSMAKIAENDYKLLCKKIENSSIVQKAKESAEAENGDEEKDLDLFELEGVEVLPETGVDVAASGAGVETSLSNRNKSLSITFPDSISKDSRIIASGIARYNLSQSYKAKGPLALPKLDPELTTNILRKSNDSDGGNDISDYSKYSSSIPVNIPISISNTSGLPAANSSVYPTSNKSNSPNSGIFIPPHLIADSQRSNDPTHKFGSKPPESNIKRYKRVF